MFTQHQLEILVVTLRANLTHDNARIAKTLGEAQRELMDHKIDMMVHRAIDKAMQMER